jgi:hypothetical protein
MPNIRIPAGYSLTLDDLRREPGGLHRTFIALAALDVVKSYDKAKQLIRDGKLRLPYRVGDYELSEARDLLKLLGAPLVHPDDQVTDAIRQTATTPSAGFGSAAR